MREALREANLDPSNVDYVNAHGSSTVLNDKTETTALKKVFGMYISRIPVSATKSMLGHALGASGAIEAAIVALAFQKNFLPPTIHLSTPDPECDLDYVPNTGRNAILNTVLSNSFGFGGINASLVFGRYNE
jgi:3-oxoacyl-[acyl-carrier-protein] synthase II